MKQEDNFSDAKLLDDAMTSLLKDLTQESSFECSMLLYTTDENSFRAFMFGRVYILEKKLNLILKIMRDHNDDR